MKLNLIIYKFFAVVFVLGLAAQTIAVPEVNNAESNDNLGCDKGKVPDGYSFLVGSLVVLGATVFVVKAISSYNHKLLETATNESAS